MNSGILLFLVLGLVAVAAAVGMLLSRNAVYAVLFLVLNFVAVAVLYLILGAPFIALAQITVYAGAIMILFLFVIMLLGAEQLRVAESIPWQRPLAITLAVILAGLGGYLLVVRSGANAILPSPAPDFGSPTDVGMDLFNKYLLPFEITSVLLLVAVVGAVVLTKVERRRRFIDRVSGVQPRDVQVDKPQAAQVMEDKAQGEAQEGKVIEGSAPQGKKE